MNSSKYRVSAEALFPDQALKLHESQEIDAPHLVCINKVRAMVERVKKMELGDDQERPVLHVPCNRMGNRSELLYKLNELGVTKILLLNGSPGYADGEPEDIFKCIRFFNDAGLEVQVGSYIQSFFGGNSQRHIGKQMDLLKKKLDFGAAGVVTNPSFNIDTIERWMEEYRSFSKAPVSLGVTPKGDPDAVKKFVKDKIKKRDVNWNRVEMDFGWRVWRSLGFDVQKLIREVHSRRILTYRDGFHLTGVPGSDQIALAEFIKQL